MYQDITPTELQQRQAQGALVIDVREDWEYESAHIPGARNIPLSELPEQADSLRGKVVLVCASGNRSARAAQYLTEIGVTDVANLMGGTGGWIAAGLPVEASS